MVKEIIHFFKKEFYSGNLKPGDKLQSRRFYEIKFKASKKTMEKVFSFLELTGFIFSVPKKGYFVQSIEKQNWWRSENQLNIYDVEIEKKDISPYFKLEEIKNIFEHEEKLDLKNYYSYIKYYSLDEKVVKVQLSYIEKSLEFKKEQFRHSFYYYLSKNDIKDESMHEIIRGGIKIPDFIKKLLNTKEKKGIAIFVLIKNDKNIPIGIGKLFKKSNDINLKNISYIF